MMTSSTREARWRGEGAGGGGGKERRDLWRERTGGGVEKGRKEGRQKRRLQVIVNL